MQLKVESDIEVRQLMQKIAKIKETNLEIKEQHTETILFTVNPISNTVRQVLKPDFKVSSIEYQ